MLIGFLKEVEHISYKLALTQCLYEQYRYECIGIEILYFLNVNIEMLIF